MEKPLLLGMFHRMIEGDHHLLELEQRRFSEAGIGAEFSPDSPDDLQAVLEFRPFSEPRYTIHLPRETQLFGGRGSGIIEAFARRSRTDAYGMIVHDQAELKRHFNAYVQMVHELDGTLAAIERSPLLFIEYAAGLDPDLFVSFFERIADCQHVSACIDIGHIGIRAVQHAYAAIHPAQDVCALTPSHPSLLEVIEDVNTACAAVLPIVLDIVRALGTIGKPLHFHLHDGHPLSTLSRYGVSDHLSFYQEINLPFTPPNAATPTSPLLFGPEGAQAIVETALAALPAENLSFTFEIHPQERQCDLGPYDYLFANWRDMRHAEQMMAWLEMLLRNLAIVRQTVVNHNGG